MAKKSKSSLESTVDKLLQKIIHSDHNIESAKKELGSEALTPEIERLLDIAQHRWQAGEATDLFGFYLARVLEEALDALLEMEKKHITNRLPDILIRDQYLTPRDKKLSVGDVHANLKDASYLQRTYSLNGDDARKVVVEAENIGSSETYNRRRQKGVAFLSRAVLRFAANKKGEGTPKIETEAQETKSGNDDPSPFSGQKSITWPVAMRPLNIFWRPQIASIIERLTLFIPGEQTPHIIVLAGPPGSGKTTIVNTIC